MQCPPPLESVSVFRIKHITRNKHEIAFFEIKCTFIGRKENTIRVNPVEMRKIFENLSFGVPLVMYKI